MNTEKRKLTTMDLTCIAVCTVLIAVCSWISIPSVVPFTLQTFAVFCVLELLGGKRGTIAIVVYILWRCWAFRYSTVFPAARALYSGPPAAISSGLS
jgi:biotin transporter BioY